jgi:hypothetical protein
MDYAGGNIMPATKTAIEPKISVPQGGIEIGATAGAIWDYLHAHGPTTQTQVIKELGLPRDLVLKGIGWLAREDKLLFVTGRTPKLALREQ